MNHLIVEFKKTTEYVAHFEIMLATKHGYQPLMTWHPGSGDIPKMFNSHDEAEFYLDDNKNKNELKEMIRTDLGNYKIIFVPKDDKYVQHFAILEKGLLFWKEMETFHPISGDRPVMCDSWKEAKDKIYDRRVNDNSIKRKLGF